MIVDKFTTDNDPLVRLYEHVLSCSYKSNIVTEYSDEAIDTRNDEIPIITVVKIYVKSGDNNPELMYKADVTDYDERDELTTITAETKDNRRVIVKTQDNFIDVTILDQNDNIQDEFNVNGMQFQDIDNPEELSILKIEQTD